MIRRLHRALIWFNTPDQFESMTDFLRQRKLLRSAQFIMAMVAASASLVPISDLVDWHQMSGAAIAASAVTAVFTVGLAAFWLARWPTRWQSEITVLTGAVLIAVWSALQESAGLAALACTALAVTGGYFAFFHNLRSLFFNYATAVTAAGFAAARLAEEAALSSAFAAFWIVWFLNLSVPVAVRGMSQAMGTYATRADEDGLTGLLNRRSFAKVVGRKLREPEVRPGAQLVLILADIDEFKRINDTFGHAAGDLVILAVADILRKHSPPDAALCRAGGEEFLVAVTTPPAALPLAHQLREAIAGLPDGLSASVGLAQIDLPVAAGLHTGDLVARLIAEADAAMYTAKRSGGNTVHQASGYQA